MKSKNLFNNFLSGWKKFKAKWDWFLSVLRHIGNFMDNFPPYPIEAKDIPFEEVTPTKPSAKSDTVNPEQKRESTVSTDEKTDTSTGTSRNRKSKVRPIYAESEPIRDGSTEKQEDNESRQQG